MDSEGQQVGQILKGHKKVMAIKSSTFEAMFYGPLKEEEDPVVIKETTFEAFKNLLNFIHDIVEDWSKVELPELLHTANLAERFNLPKMKQKVLENLQSFAVTEDNMLETAATAEEFGCLVLESEVLLQACSSVLEDSLVTPEDVHKFMVEQSVKDDKQGMVGIRLLARVKFEELPFDAMSNEKIISIVSIAKKIKKSSNTRSDLLKLKDLIEGLVGVVSAESIQMYYRTKKHLLFPSLVKSLVKSIVVDQAAAAAMGNQVQPEDVVERTISHLQSVQLHLDLIDYSIDEDSDDDQWFPLEKFNELWESILLNTVPAVHSVFFDWLDDFDFRPEDKEKVLAKLVLYTGPRSDSYDELKAAITGV